MRNGPVTFCSHGFSVGAEQLVDVRGLGASIERGVLALRRPTESEFNAQKKNPGALLRLLAG
jgi:hypothetical protein